MLLDYGADINMLDNYGKNIFSYLSKLDSNVKFYFNSGFNMKLLTRAQYSEIGEKIM